MWLGHYLPSTQHYSLQITQVLSSPVPFIFYSRYCRQSSSPFARVLKAPLAELEKVVPPLDCPDFPTYLNPVPGYGMFISQLYYSEAPLEGVIRVQSRYDTDRCIGLLLDYGTHSQTVGYFRCEKRISNSLDQPQSVMFFYEQDHTHDCKDVKFSRRSARPGRICVLWWVQWYGGIVQICVTSALSSNEGLMNLSAGTSSI